MQRASRDGSYHSELAETHVPGGHTSGSRRNQRSQLAATIFLYIDKLTIFIFFVN
jgi:hypothetical protein